MAVTSQIKRISGKPDLFNMGIVKFYNLYRKDGENVKIAYVRVSTQEQNLDRQLELLKPYGIEKFFQEKQSGKDMGREKLNELLKFVREGDEVYVESWLRLSRTVSDLLKLFELFDRKKARLYSVKEQYDTSSPTGKLMVNIIAALNQFERENLLEKQREGIACWSERLQINETFNNYNGSLIWMDNFDKVYTPHYFTDEDDSNFDRVC